eukprot:3385466-Alexandrium_andersonii.AAC.1
MASGSHPAGALLAPSLRPSGLGPRPRPLRCAQGVLPRPRRADAAALRARGSRTPGRARESAFMAEADRTPPSAPRRGAPARTRVRQHPCAPCALAPRRCVALGPSPTPGPAGAAQPRCAYTFACPAHALASAFRPRRVPMYVQPPGVTR